MSFKRWNAKKGKIERVETMRINIAIDIIPVEDRIEASKEEGDPYWEKQLPIRGKNYKGVHNYLLLPEPPPDESRCYYKYIGTSIYGIEVDARKL